MEVGPSLYKLRDGVTFLNHGSFGKAPREVLAKQQELRDELEEEPVDFLARKIYQLMPVATAALAEFIGAPPHSVVFFRNVTCALNAAVRAVLPGLITGPEDEVLACDHEYGACDRLFVWTLEQSGRAASQYRRLPFECLRDDPACTQEALADEFCARFTPHTRVVFLSHITSVTALILPVALICARARARGIVTIIDGAHALGQIDLDMAAIGADYYAGNCHKWLQSPKGCGFLYAAANKQAALISNPAVVSWGWRREDAGLGIGLDPLGSELEDVHGWPGTDDPTAPLCIPTCIAFQRRHDYPNVVRPRCHELAQYARQQVAALTGLPQLYPDSPAFYGQMALMPVPGNARELHKRLWEEFRVEIPGIVWKGRHFLRASCQFYTTRADIDRLLACLKIIWNK